MSIELDHCFILTDPGAPQADLLSGIGLTEGTRNDHPGQGTANRRFFFLNTALELVYVSDENEAANGRGSRLRFPERAKNSNASPFGLIVRATSESSDVPFPGWRYCPEYFRADQCFHVGENSDVLEEPLCICMPCMPPVAASQPPPLEPFTEVAELRVSVPVDRPSAVLETVARCERITLTLGEPHQMEIVFNEGQAGQSKDLRPELPLVVRW